MLVNPRYRNLTVLTRDLDTGVTRSVSDAWERGPWVDIVNVNIESSTLLYRISTLAAYMRSCEQARATNSIKDVA